MSLRKPAKEQPEKFEFTSDQSSCCKRNSF